MMFGKKIKILVIASLALFSIYGIIVIFDTYNKISNREPEKTIQLQNDESKIKGLFRNLKYAKGYELDQLKQDFRKVGSPVVPQLLEKFKDTDARWETLSAVGDLIVEIGDSNLIRPVLKDIYLDNNVDYRIKILANIALVKIGEDSLFDQLIIGLHNPDSNIRDKIAKTLGEIGDLRGVEPLINLLDSKENKYVRGTVALALANLGDKRAIKPLIDALKYEDNLVLYDDHIGYGRSPIDNALEKLGASKEQLIKGYVVALGSSNKYIRGHAVYELSKLVDKNHIEAVVPLLKFLDQEKDCYFSCTALIKSIESLGQIGDKRAVIPLINLFNNSRDAWVAASAAYWLGSLGDRRAEKHLIAGLDRNVTNIIDASARALGKLGNNQTAEVLIEYLEKRGVSTRTLGVIIALGNLGNKKAVEPLCKLLNHEEQEYYIPEFAAKALAKLGDKNAIAPLLDALKFDNYKEQFSSVSRGYREIEKALKGLEATKQQMVRGYINALLNSNSSIYSYVRQNAAKKLGDLGDVKAVEPLIIASMQKERRYDEYKEIFSALVKLGDKRTMDILAEKLSSESSHKTNFLIRETLDKIEKKLEKEARDLIEQKLDPRHYHLIRKSDIQKVVKFNGKFKLIFDKGFIWDRIIIVPDSI